MTWKHGYSIATSYCIEKWNPLTNFICQQLCIWYVCIGSRRRCWSTPISTQTASNLKEKKWHIKNTTTSVSTVAANTRFTPLIHASINCTTMRLSASIQLDDLWYLMLQFDSTFENLVVTICVGQLILLKLLEIIWKSSVLLSSHLIKSWNFL